MYEIHDEDGTAYWGTGGPEDVPAFGRGGGGRVVEAGVSGNRD